MSITCGASVSLNPKHKVSYVGTSQKRERSQMRLSATTISRTSYTIESIQATQFCTLSETSEFREYTGKTKLFLVVAKRKDGIE